MPCRDTDPSRKTVRTCNCRHISPRTFGTYSGRHGSSTQRRRCGQPTCGILPRRQSVVDVQSRRWIAEVVNKVLTKREDVPPCIEPHETVIADVHARDGS